MALVPTYGEQSVNDLILKFRNRQINLEPGFQRNSVWTFSDRRRLIESVVANCPLPSIFLYKRHQRGRLIYDVIDGKQRIETLLMFTRTGKFRRSSFDVKFDLDGEVDWYDWTDVCGVPDVRAHFDSYKIQTTEVEGEFSDIVDLFVRINSTGKRLTSGEKRHARFYSSHFLKTSSHLVDKYERYLESERILTRAQIDRMKGTELFAELLMSIQNGSPINKKIALDRSIGNQAINLNTLARLEREFLTTMNLIKRMFPRLREIRFHNSAEFYSLFLLVWQMHREGLVLHDQKRNSIAFALLRKLSTGVDQLRDQLRRARPAKSTQRIYSDYLLTVQGDTDSSANRERRGAILRGVLWSLYERKDERRLFSPEQRRIIWNSDEKRLCAKCHKPMTWDDFSVDHVVAHTRGGKTSLTNAQPMHRACNSRKGAH